MSQIAIIAMGTNMAYRGVSGGALLSQALAAIEQAGIAVTARSSVWQTAAWPPGADQPDYYNAVITVETDAHTPRSLYDLLREIEISFGRERRERWASRTLDLDLVAMGDLAGVFDGIELPHPRMQERGFVLAPLAEVSPGWRHPVLGRTVAQLLADLPPEQGYRSLGRGWA